MSDIIGQRCLAQTSTNTINLVIFVEERIQLQDVGILEADVSLCLSNPVQLSFPYQLGRRPLGDLLGQLFQPLVLRDLF